MTGRDARAPAATSGARSERTFGVLGAMAEEVENLVAAVEDLRTRHVGPFALHTGRLERRRVIVAECGIGKANAAALTQALIGAGADAVIFTGVAGAADPRLGVGDIVVSADAAQHDVDVTALGYALGEIPGDGCVWAADAALIALAEAAARDTTGRSDASGAPGEDAGGAAGGCDATGAPGDGADGVPGGRVVVGRVVSGDQFVASATRVRELRERFGAACVEMEGAAVAQVCSKWGVPFVIVRSISDTADQDAQVDFRAFTRLAAARAERVVRGILRRISED